MKGGGKFYPRGANGKRPEVSKGKLWATLKALPFREREALTQKFVRGMSAVEISRMRVEHSHKTQVQLWSALSNLRGVLGKKGKP